MNKINFTKKIQIILNNFKSENYENTIVLIKKMLKEYPNHEYLLNLLGLCYQNTKKIDDAIKTFENISKLNPSNHIARNNYASLLKNNQQISLARDILENIVNKFTKYIPALNNLANLYKDLNRHDLAIELYKKIIFINEEENNKYSKQMGIVHYNLSLCYQQIGDSNNSINHANLSLKKNEQLTNAYGIISAQTDYSIESNMNKIEEMEKQANNKTLNEMQKAQVLFSLGKAYEDRKDYSNAFTNFEKANEIFKNNIKFDFKNELNQLNLIKKIFSKFASDKLSNNYKENYKIIFICGMPRSGTTLVEQIISTHKNVEGLGETDFISKIIEKEFNFYDMNLENKILDLYKKDINKILNLYKENLGLLNLSKNVLTDKSLLNFKNIGFIKMFFPNSKIIINLRDFKNNFLSIFKNNLPGLKWSYDENNIKEYYNIFIEYYKLWQKLYPNTIYNLKYENLIDQTEEEINKLLNFCDLVWDPNCVNFYNKNKSPIKTASVNQANKPVYKDSKNKYDFYKEYFN